MTLIDQMAEFQRCVEQRDGAGATGVLDEEFALVLTYPQRAVMPRAQWLALLPEYIVHAYELQEQVVDLDGDCAYVMHRAAMRATVAGQDRSGLFTISDLWRLREEGWRLWRRHSTPLAAQELPTN